MTVYIDDRAGSKELIRFQPLKDTGELCRLNSGDAAFTGNGPDGDVIVGVEVKSIFDLIGSIRTGRLQGTQIPRMVAEFDVCWLLYYGCYRPAVRGNDLQINRGGKWKGYRLGKQKVPYGYVEGFLLTLSASGVLVKRVSDPREAAAWIGVLHRWYGKRWDQHKGMRTFDNSRAITEMPEMDPGVLLRARVASQLPGVGFERAMAVGRHFGSVTEMVGASEEEWAQVEGIGPVIASAVKGAMR